MMFLNQIGFALTVSAAAHALAAGRPIFGAFFAGLASYYLGLIIERAGQRRDR